MGSIMIRQYLMHTLHVQIQEVSSEDFTEVLTIKDIRRHPILAAINDDLVCAFAQIDSSDGPAGSHKHLYLFGPVLKPEDAWLSHNLTITGKENLLKPADDSPAEWGTMMSLARAAVLLYYSCSRDQSDGDGPLPFQPEPVSIITPDDLVSMYASRKELVSTVRHNYNDLIFNNMENNVIHNPYNQEVRSRQALENGDVEELKRIQGEDYSDRNGIIAHDPIRQEINIGIVVTTNARAAAAHAGVSPEICYSLSDATILAMEESRDVMSIRHIYRSSEVHYAELVRDLKSRQKGKRNEEAEANMHISHCKDYIFAHLHSKLTVGEIAAAIGLEANYLSALFHRLEGITLKQFILNEKIALVKNMLAYSPYSYIEIANYLGFASQSHLGEQFRKVTGTTMRKYRTSHMKDDFLQDMSEDGEDVT